MDAQVSAKVIEVLLDQIDVLKQASLETEAVAPPRVQLHCDPRSTCSIAVLTVLHELHCEFELVVVDLAKKVKQSSVWGMRM